MITVLICFIVMLFVFGGMAVGVLCGRPSIRGTCGGINGVKGMGDSCQMCAGVCKRENRHVEQRAGEVEF
jgi:hypothetical protein